MSELDQEVKNLLLKHDYITTLQKSGDGCIITYPHPKLLNDYPRLVEAFTIQRGDKSGLWATTSYDSDAEFEERFFEIPEYAIRLYIVCEVSACNNSVPVNPALMVFLDEDEAEHENIEDVLEAPDSDEDKKKEGFLYRLVIEARNDGFPPEYAEVAETHGVSQGYQLIRKFYE